MPLEVITALISTGGLIAVAIIQNRHNKRADKKLSAVQDQVQNTHKTNLRHDLDVIRDEMRNGFARQARDNHDFRQDLALIHSQIAQLNTADLDARKEHASIWEALRSLGRAA